MCPQCGGEQTRRESFENLYCFYCESVVAAPLPEEPLAHGSLCMLRASTPSVRLPALMPVMGGWSLVPSWPSGIEPYTRSSARRTERTAPSPLPIERMQDLFAAGGRALPSRASRRASSHRELLRPPPIPEHLPRTPPIKVVAVPDSPGGPASWRPRGASCVIEEVQGEEEEQP
ncbi:MAG: hypothetical protein KGJ23_06870 [Euryarchaeota archaeon]|nr:hypothetical protein [Euryarchaeota archaeon]MDE1879120.1 hypothetical protein [Euryarchaeota archaeon]